MKERAAKKLDIKNILKIEGKIMDFQIYPIGSTVYINDGSIKSTVVAFCIRLNRITYEVVYFDNLNRKVEWVDDFEISKAEKVKAKIGYL